jgi:hypothetical protein
VSHLALLESQRRQSVTPEDKKERLFLIPEEEYDKRGTDCFVIDPQRHAIWEHSSDSLVQ